METASRIVSAYNFINIGIPYFFLDTDTCMGILFLYNLYPHKYILLILNEGVFP